MILRRETNIYDDEAIKNSIATIEKKVSATYGTCSTAASTVAKVVTLADFVLFKGAQISVHFTYNNTASAPTLNVNGTGAKAIWARGAAIAATYYWSANSTHTFTYDGTHWVLDNAESQEEVYKRLTNNDTNSGLYIENGSLYIKADYIKTGSLLADLITTGKIQSQNGMAYFDLDNNILQCTTMRSAVTTSMSGTDLGNYVMDFATKTYSGSRRVHLNIYNSRYPNNALSLWTPDDSRVGYGSSYITTTANALILCANTDKWYGNYPSIEVHKDSIVIAGPETTSGGTSITYQITATNGHTLGGGGNLNGTWKVNGSVINTTSARRYKHDITNRISDELDAHRLYRLEMKQFVYNDGCEQYFDTKGVTIPGFIAEDVAEVYPSAVIHNQDGEIESWDGRRIIPAMLKLIQEQHEEIEKLKQVIHIA